MGRSVPLLLAALGAAGLGRVRADRGAVARASPSTFRRARTRGAWRATRSRSCRRRSGSRSALNDVLLLRNLDDVPQMFGPTIMMPGQSFRLPFEKAAEYQFVCTAHASGQMTIDRGAGAGDAVGADSLARAQVLGRPVRMKERR